jgi:hypothetical protein
MAIHDLAGRYRSENGAYLIEISLSRIQQLFNSLDPSPFHEKDLDADAESYIVGAAREFHLATPLKIVLHLPAAEAAAASRLEESIHSYFSYRRESAGRDLRFLLRQGRLTSAIGLAFLAACLSLRAVIFASAAGTAQNIVAEGLVITGWVAMWRPIQIFLYDWWPLRRMVLIYDKLARISVEVRSVAPAIAATAPPGLAVGRS